MNIPFSQRYGYTKPSNVIIRENLSGAILNAVLNAFIELYNKDGFSSDFHWEMNHDFARYFQNYRLDKISEHILYYMNFISNEKEIWHKRIDAIEWIIAYHRKQLCNSIFDWEHANNQSALNKFIEKMNWEFKRLNYAYRIINDVFIETTSESELSTINETLESSDSDVITHLSECLKLMSPSNPQISTRNAIKEAISAVEVIARKVTNTKTLDDAFKRFNNLHPQIKSSMSSLYQYTNQPNTGIRHAWMNQQEEPTIDEAIFVLVTGCAFINYLRKLYNK